MRNGRRSRADTCAEHLAGVATVEMPRATAVGALFVTCEWESLNAEYEPGSDPMLKVKKGFHQRRIFPVHSQKVEEGHVKSDDEHWRYLKVGDDEYYVPEDPDILGAKGVRYLQANVLGAYAVAAGTREEANAEFFVPEDKAELAVCQRQRLESGVPYEGVIYVRTLRKWQQGMRIRLSPPYVEEPEPAPIAEEEGATSSRGGEPLHRTRGKHPIPRTPQKEPEPDPLVEAVDELRAYVVGEQIKVNTALEVLDSRGEELERKVEQLQMDVERLNEHVGCAVLAAMRARDDAALTRTMVASICVQLELKVPEEAHVDRDIEVRRLGNEWGRRYGLGAGSRSVVRMGALPQARGPTPVAASDPGESSGSSDTGNVSRGTFHVAKKARVDK